MTIILDPIFASVDITISPDSIDTDSLTTLALELDDLLDSVAFEADYSDEIVKHLSAPAPGPCITQSFPVPGIPPQNYIASQLGVDDFIFCNPNRQMGSTDCQMGSPEHHMGSTDCQMESQKQSMSQEKAVMDISMSHLPTPPFSINEMADNESLLILCAETKP